MRARPSQKHYSALVEKKKKRKRKRDYGNKAMRKNSNKNVTFAFIK